MRLMLDCETRSPVAIRHGTPRYATAADVMIVSWAADDGPAKVWDYTETDKVPADLDWAIDEADEVWAHTSYFDRTLLRGKPLYLYERVPMHKWRCTMTLALAHGLPGGLDKLCDIFKVEASKAKINGKDFIKMFCVPKKNGEFNDRHSHPAEWKAFLNYATLDVVAMQEVHRKCPKWNYAGESAVAQRETRLWHLDQRFNDRGFAVDMPFVDSAIRALSKEKARLDGRTQELTGYDEEKGIGVKAATQRDRLLKYLLEEYGVSLPDMRADTLERRLEDPELPEFIKDLLRVRLQSSKASTSKYKRVQQMQVGGRMCNTMQFAGALRTGRWNGRGFQPLNLPRPQHKWKEIQTAIEALKADAIEVLDFDVMGVCSSALRSVIIAPKGKKLVISDLSNIEGRKLAWLADEKWKIKAFADFDKGIGYDLYKLAYARLFNILPEDVDDFMRQIGKVLELSMGYGGGVGAFVTMVATYGIDLEDMARRVMPVLPRMVIRDAEGVWTWACKQRRTLGLSKEVYVACEAVKRLWRDAHPATTTMWEAVENATRNAIQNPGVKFTTNKCTFIRQKTWLYIVLPSGRMLCYPEPRIDGGTISYMGVNAYSKKWQRITTYGGKTTEQIDQGSSRDVFAEAIPMAEDMGYLPVLLVHDELVTETDDTDDYRHESLSMLLATNSPWNAGLPLAAAGFTTHTYRKH